MAVALFGLVFAAWGGAGTVLGPPGIALALFGRAAGGVFGMIARLALLVSIALTLLLLFLVILYSLEATDLIEGARDIANLS